MPVHLSHAMATCCKAMYGARGVCDLSKVKSGLALTRLEDAFCPRARDLGAQKLPC